MRFAGAKWRKHGRRDHGADGYHAGGPQVAGPVDGRRRPIRRVRRRALALPGDDVDVDVSALPDQLVDDRSEQGLAPAGTRGLAEHDAGDVPPARVRENLGGDVVAGEGHGLRAELLRQAERLDDPVPVRGREARGGGRLDVHDDPLGPEADRHPPGGAHDARGEGTRADAHQDPLRDRPDARHGVLAPVPLHLGVDALRRRPQRELPQRDEIALPEEAAHGLAGLLGDVDLPVTESPDQIVGREIHQLDLRRLLQDRVGDGLARRDLGHPGDDVVQALEVLDVERRVDVDARGQELRDVLPALGVPRARRVRVGQLVDEDERGAAREGGVEIELAEHRAAVLDRARRQPLEPGQERLRLGPAVGLDPADHHVDTRRVLGSRGLEHRISLPDAGGGAEEHLELSARLTRLFLSDVRQ